MLQIYSDATVDSITAYLKDNPVIAFTRKNESVQLNVQPDNFVIIPAGHRVRIPTGLSVESTDTGYVMQTAGAAFTKALRFLDPLVVLSEGDLFIDVQNISEVPVVLTHGDNLGKVVAL